MSLVWRKIQRSNKKAAKFRFIAQFQELSINCSKKWQPSKVAVAWVHRRRRYFTKDHQWEPTITDPYRGLIIWPQSNPETLEITTTLYRDSRHENFDDKEWTFIVEETTSRGKRKPIAGVNLNMRLFINEIPGTQTELKLKLKPLCEHLVGCQLQLVLTCVIVKEGNANDDDMQSIASIMSVRNTNKDIAHLPDLDDEEFGSTNSFGSGSMDQSPAKNPNSEVSLFSEVFTKIDALKDVSNDFPAKQRTPANQNFVQTTSSNRMSDSQASNRTSDSQASKRTSDSQAPITSTPKSLSTKDSGIDATTASLQSPDQGNTSQDLLSWCQTITKCYKRVKIIDFSTSWRNGLAFCAIVNYFRPDMVDFDTLNPSNIRENCRQAFDAAASLGVPKLIDPSDMVIMAIPDKIAIMTYVYMLRNHFTGQPMPEDHQSQQNSVFKSSTSDYIDLAANSPDSYCNGPSSTVNQVQYRTSTLPESQDTNSKKRHESRQSARDSSGILQKMKPRKSSSGTSSERSSAAGSPITADRISLTLSTENIQKPKLMTRNQLMNPFDSDEEKKDSQTDKNDVQDGKIVLQAPKIDTQPSKNDDARPSVSNQIEISRSPNEPANHSARPETQVRPDAQVQSTLPRQEDLKRRARELLDSYKIDRERTPELQDDERRRELKDRARKMIEDVKLQTLSGSSRAVKISETFNLHKSDRVPVDVPEDQIQKPKALSAPSTRNATPEHSLPSFKLTTLRPLHEGLSVSKNSANVDFYQFGKNFAPPSSPPMITKESLLSQTARTTRRPYPAAKIIEEVQTNVGAIDRFKRFGSMRGQELAQSISILSNRLTTTVRSSSEPKEMAVLRQSSVTSRDVGLRQQMSVEREISPVKFDAPMEHEFRSHGQLLAEMDDVSAKQKELDRKATEVEKRWRLVMQEASGSDEEQRLMNEYLSLLNERNMLTRREMHLSLLENISDYENKFQLVQKDLGELIRIEDCEKTEVHKQQIDRLMEELINIVNKRDVLMQQLLAHEQGTEEDAELADNVMSQSNLLPTGDKEGCSIQ